MADNPAPARLAHDLLAQDERMLFHNDELADLLFTADSDARCAAALKPLIADCYGQNATFRRLFNYHAAISGGIDHRYRLAAADTCGMTATAEQIAAAGGKTLTLMLDGEGLPLPDGEITAQRAMLHEVLRAITGLDDDPDHLNRRGAVAEYANIVLADRGEPARASCGAGRHGDSRRPEGSGLPRPAVSLLSCLRRRTQEQRDDIVRRKGQTSPTVAMEGAAGGQSASSASPASSVANGAQWRSQAGSAGAEVTKASRGAKFSRPTPVLAPMQGISKLPGGRYVVTIDGYARKVRFNADKGMWHLTGPRESGFVIYKKVQDSWRWERFAPGLFRRRPSSNARLPKMHLIDLPPIKSMPADAMPIPKNIYYIWIGGRMPEKNCLNIIENARKSYNEKKNAGYRTTIYVDANDPVVLAQMRVRFKGLASYLTVENLRETAFFRKFRETKFAGQYEAARSGKYPCYSAASDVLRYRLIRFSGGIYMDADDSIENPVAHIGLPASAEDLLLNGTVSNPMMNLTDAFNGSVFGSHPNNGLLKKISEESYARFAQEASFFDKERPYSGGSDEPSGEDADRMKAYAQKISMLFGPGLLNDVLKLHAGDLYDLSLMALETQEEMGVYLPRKYHQALQKSYDYRLPFAHAWDVAIGADHSWEST
jgi:hypothetical protein